MTPPTVEQLQHACPQCGTVLQYQPASGGLPYKCPACSQVGQLPPAPQPKDPITRQHLDEAADRLKNANKERKRWRRIRLGLTVLYGCSWAMLAVVTVGLPLFLLAWFGSLLAWPDTSKGPVLLGVIGLLLGIIDMVAVFGYYLCRQAPRSSGVHQWIQANLLVAGLRTVACLGSGTLVLAVGFPANAPEPRLAVGLAGMLFLTQWVLHVLFLRAVAHAHCCVWLMRHAFNWLFLLAVTVVVGVFVPLVWPAGSGGELRSAEWFDAVVLGFLGLLSAALTWLCFAWHVRLLHSVRLAIPV